MAHTHTFLILAAVCLVGATMAVSLQGTQPTPVMVVDLVGQPIPVQIAAQVCIGLFNRRPLSSHGAAYSLLSQPNDGDWLADVLKGPHGSQWQPRNVTIPSFMRACLLQTHSRHHGAQARVAQSVSKGFLRYNFSSQQALLPVLLTVAAVQNAVPLEDDSPYAANSTLVFDAITTFANMTTLQVTSYVYDHYVNQTTTLAFMDPGYQGAQKNPFSPKLTGTPNPALIDHIVKERLFNFYLVEACIPLTADHTFTNKMAQNNPWPKPIAVWGYDDTFPVAGDLFEAETTCTKSHNMGQIASDSVNNLSFLSLAPSITEPLTQNPTPIPAFNASKTYMAFTVGDGDNLGYLKGARRSWMEQRTARCSSDPSTCFPLLWSISAHPLTVAPDWLYWYYKQALQNKHDFFVLPPSGALYAYPSQMPPGVQEQFVAQTEQLASLLSTSASVAWEFALTWGNAIKEYFPRYDHGAMGKNAARSISKDNNNNKNSSSVTEKGTIVNGFFAVNVPFMFPVLEFGSDEFFKVLGPSGQVVLFKPREWRGSNPHGAPPFSGKEYLTPTQMAAEINGYPAGTVSHIYLTSDGGGNLDMLYQLVALLGDHVEVVNHRALVAMALASAKQ